MGIEDPQGKRDVEQDTKRASENRNGSASDNSKKDAAIRAQQQQTRDAIKKTLGG
jgi:hypothetical protein